MSGTASGAALTVAHSETVLSSREEKERLVAAAFMPEARVSEIARTAGVHVSQLFRWRKELCQISAPSVPQLIPVEIVEPPPSSPAEPPVSRPRKRASIVTIELGRGRRLRVESDVDPEALGRISDVLERR
ncbi:transposase (plasmid) [Sinorhizobium sp. M103]|uniref:IS66-like element accessory protein TnpA n=1 Tax=Sinorhizobium sp. M103 TaxID=2976821 RepID=UPI0023D815DC|nr:transposase [Sinorhizobium sp. M103]WEJ12968.1 transposase [Sinorhizobium sp. M103]